MNEVNSRAKVTSNKTMNRNKPVEEISVAKKPERQIPKGHRFSIKKTLVVHEKTMTPRSCLRWKPTGKIFKTVGLRWIPTGKIFDSSTTKVDSDPTNGSNKDITNQYECEQTLDVSACTLNLSASTSFNPKRKDSDSELGIHDHSIEPSNSKLVPKVVPLADKTTTLRQELELLFHHHITMLSWKSYQGDSSKLNLPDHRLVLTEPEDSYKDGDGDTSFQLRNKNDDAHEHIEKVLDIVSLFNIPDFSHDAIMLRVFPITLSEATKRWIYRIPTGTINTWDLLKKASSKGPLRYYTRVENLPPFGEKKPSLEEVINKHIEESTRRRNKTED
ncbi:hypothetical protein Tco_0753529 [Tanacetum coccineum]